MLRLARIPSPTTFLRRGIHSTTRIRAEDTPGAWKMTVVEANEDTFAPEVLHSKTPVLVDFYADWCGPCRMLAPVITKAVQATQGKVRLVKVDVEACGKIAEAHQITALPTVVLFRNGKEVDRFVGMKDLSFIGKFVKNASA